ncbi:hypothetical protein MesoLjLb_73850 [Mesorhizobium sp. L-8-3]|nr:hypothetical protein MesoLjLb_73850 [Mesorhizobium sp. L-8-3]
MSILPLGAMIRLPSRRLSAMFMTIASRLSAEIYPMLGTPPGLFPQRPPRCGGTTALIREYDFGPADPGGAIAASPEQKVKQARLAYRLNPAGSTAPGRIETRRW